jgi:hypothetical protein
VRLATVAGAVCASACYDLSALRNQQDGAVSMDGGQDGSQDASQDQGTDLSADGSVDLAACFVRGGVCLPNPVGYWTLDEGSGTSAGDASGNMNPGALTNGPTWVTGKVGAHAVNFDGVDDVVLIGDPASGTLDFGTGSFTYGLWVYVTASAGMYDTPWSKGGSSAAHPGYDIECGTGAWSVNLNDGTTAKQANFGNETLNQWVHLAVVVDRNASKFFAYLNGVLVATIDITGLGSLSTGESARIGSGLSNPFKGQVDDVIVFDRALSAAEVLALAQ